MNDNIILTTPSELVEIVQEAVRQALPREALAPKQPAPSETLDLRSAIRLFSERGYPISKSRIYKLTASHHIPHRKYGTRLIFHRAELLQWLESQTCNPSDSVQTACDSVAQSARKQLIR